MRDVPAAPPFVPGAPGTLPPVALTPGPSAAAAGPAAGGAPPAAHVGKVLGTESSTPFEWFVAIDPDAYLQVGDVVQVVTQVPGLGAVTISGIVNNVHALMEGAKFEGDVFLAGEGVLPVQLARGAHVKTTRVVPEFWVPPQPGDDVVRPTGAEREQALYFDQMERRLVAGMTRDGRPFYVDYEFLCGVRGGHANISGISGVATKTTYASFFLYSMFAGQVLGREAPNTKALIFNVKGEDLLFLDKPNAKLTEEQRQKYAALGLPAGPFPSVGIWAPVRKHLAASAAAVPESASRHEGVSAYYWTVRDIVRDRLLRFMFAEASDAQSQVSDLALRVESVLSRECREHPRDGASLQVDTATGPRTLGTFAELCDYVEESLGGGDNAWTGNAAPGTVSAFVRRLRSAEFHLGHLIRGAGAPDTPHQIAWEDRQVTVVDINKLHDRAKRFVVGVMLTRLFEAKEESGEAEPRVYVVLDELNKYAPREGWSPIKEVLLDIAERGRSLGIILLGAEQTASEVERRIVSNAAVRVVGRLDPSEAKRPEYGFLDEVSRERAALLKPGTMLVMQPHIPMPIEVTFPFPSWATRKSEVADDPVAADPFGEFGF